jgi:gamma-glutamylputrescine oxidase
MGYSGRFTEGSFWINAAPSSTAPVEGSTRCDIVIVGGGFIGLNAALRLKAAGVDVAVLEKDFCGAGASGRNAGHVGSTMGKDIYTCLKTFGPEKGLALARLGDAAVDHFNQRVEELGLQCDYERTGNAVVGLHPSQKDVLKRSVDLVLRHGLNFEFLDEAAMAARGLPPAFRFGALETEGGVLNPGKLVLGLRNKALEAGVRIYEGTLVQRLAEDSGGVLITTPQGEMRAKAALLAVNAYAPETLALLKTKVLPVRVSLFVTRPLKADEKAAVGWGGREGVYTLHESLENYRWTADGRILGGSKEVAYAYCSRLGTGMQPRIFELLQGAFRDRFPMLKSVEIEHWWGGYIAMTLDFIPTFGRLGRKSAIHYYGGCNGHGVPQGFLMGDALADHLLGRPSAPLDLLKRFEVPLPPEPLRYAVFTAINQSLLAKDRKLDLDLQAASRS